MFKNLHLCTFHFIFNINKKAFSAKFVARCLFRLCSSQKKNLDARKKNLDLGASDHASDASYLSFDTTDATAA